MNRIQYLMFRAEDDPPKLAVVYRENPNSITVSVYEKKQGINLHFKNRSSIRAMIEALKEADKLMSETEQFKERTENY